MRGEDIIAIKFNDSDQLEFLKTGAKSRKNLSNNAILKVREMLLANDELPTLHALAFVADRLYELGKKACSFD